MGISSIGVVRRKIWEGTRSDLPLSVDVARGIRKSKLFDRELPPVWFVLDGPADGWDGPGERLCPHAANNIELSKSMTGKALPSMSPRRTGYWRVVDTSTETLGAWAGVSGVGLWSSFGLLENAEPSM